MAEVKKAYRIKKIWQIDRNHFSIVWTDEKKQSFKLSDLQKRCPCSLCFDEAANKRRDDAPDVNESVAAKNIQSVGRYALRVNFTEGCSCGIYDFEFLRSIGQGESN